MADRNVDYLGQITIPVGLNNSEPLPLLVERVRLSFQSDFARSDPRTTIEVNFTDFVVPPFLLEYRNIRVIPSLLFLPNTNEFAIEVVYRLEDSGKLTDQFTTAHAGSYIMVSPAAALFGNLFISFREPQDRPLADDMEKLAKRAGFTPFVASARLDPGTRLWEEKIVPALESSNVVCYLWTSNTPNATGVLREIEIARNAKIPEVLLIENGVAFPEAQFLKDSEYTRFSRENLIEDFAKVLSALRQKR